MNRLRRTALLMAPGLAALAASTAANAQESRAVTTSNTAGDAYSDIVVTARRVEERLQDVPISMTVFSQDQLDKRNVVTASDLATWTPSLSVNERYGPEKSSFAIRGFVQDQATAPSVGVYFADVTVPRVQGGTTAGNQAPVGSFVDLQNVQVLKGPQGTLFGRNTTGGAVLLVPRKPTDKLEGYVEGSLGDYDLRRIQAVINVPIADTFKVRAMVDRNRRDGFMRNFSGNGPKRYNNVDYFAARLSVVADLTPDLENYTIATYSNSFGNGYAARIVKCNPAATGIGGIVGPAACAQLARQNARGDGVYDTEVDINQALVDLTQWQVVNTSTWKASDTLTLKNIASYSEFRERSSFSLSGGNFVVQPPSPAAGQHFQLVRLALAPGLDAASAKTFTEEFQLQGRTRDDILTWQAGAYYETSSPLGWDSGNNASFLNCTDPTALQCTNPLGIGSISAARYRHFFDNKGVYAQGTFKFTDQLSLTGGIRYTWDKMRAAGEATRVRFNPDGSTFRICNDALRFPNATNTGARIVASPAECHNEITIKSSRPTWLVDLDYKPTQDVLLYGKWARGYRMGGINLISIGAEKWGPEKVDTFEVGAKTSFHGAVSGYFNVAAFYNNFTDQQIQATLLPKAGNVLVSGAATILNAGKSRIQGIEVDASATFFRSLRFDLGYTYLDTKLKKLIIPALPPESPFGQIIPSANEGDPLALSPKNRVSLTATYTLPLDESAGELSLGATFVHTDRQVATLATLAEFQHLPATDIVNLNLDWDGVLGQPFDLSLFMTNVTKQKYPVAVTQSWFSFGFESLLYGPPRMWGARLRYKFGS